MLVAEVDYAECVVFVDDDVACWVVVDGYVVGWGHEVVGDGCSEEAGFLVLG